MLQDIIRKFCKTEKCASTVGVDERVGIRKSSSEVYAYGGTMRCCDVHSVIKIIGWAGRLETAGPDLFRVSKFQRRMQGISLTVGSKSNAALRSTPIWS